MMALLMLSAVVYMTFAVVTLFAALRLEKPCLLAPTVLQEVRSEAS